MNCVAQSRVEYTPRDCLGHTWAPSWDPSSLSFRGFLQLSPCPVSRVFLFPGLCAHFGRAYPEEECVEDKCFEILQKTSLFQILIWSNSLGVEFSVANFPSEFWRQAPLPPGFVLLLGNVDPF